MEEKVLYINLPDGADYQRVEVTDGRIGIVYREKTVSTEDSIKAPLTVSIPKPIPLIGGTEVYQKDNGTPYWYCKIKEGRDEFMHLYFGDLTEEDLFYDANGEERKFASRQQKDFRDNVLKSLSKKPKEGYRWIPVFEPSKDLKGNLQYVSGEQVFISQHSFGWWDYMFKRYSPYNGSQIATITTYFLLTLRWLKDGVVTLEQLADDSKEIGHYSDSENAKPTFEKTGEREFGGLFGFVGNSFKIVRDSESGLGFSLVGSGYSNEGSWCPLANVIRDGFLDGAEVPYFSVMDGAEHDSVGLLELTK